MQSPHVFSITVAGDLSPDSVIMHLANRGSSRFAGGATGVRLSTETRKGQVFTTLIGAANSERVILDLVGDLQADSHQITPAEAQAFVVINHPHMLSMVQRLEDEHVLKILLGEPYGRLCMLTVIAPAPTMEHALTQLAPFRMDFPQR